MYTVQYMFSNITACYYSYLVKVHNRYMYTVQYTFSNINACQYTSTQQRYVHCTVNFQQYHGLLLQLSRHKYIIDICTLYIKLSAILRSATTVISTQVDRRYILHNFVQTCLQSNFRAEFHCFAQKFIWQTASAKDAKFF